MNPATTPAPALSASSHVIAARWDEWRGMAIAHLAARHLSALWYLSVMESSHAEWLSSLLARGVPMRTIRRHALDDPLLPRPELEARVQRYHDRRYTKMKRSANVAHE